MNPPDLAFWGRFFGLLALEMGGVVALAGLLASRLHSAPMRRTVWQAAVILMGTLLVGEMVGLRGPVRRLPRPAVSESKSAVRWTVSLAPAGTIPAGEPGPLPQVAGDRAMVAAVGTEPVMWPGWVWVFGVVVIGIRSALPRIWLSSRRRRDVPGDPESLQFIRTLAPEFGVGPVTMTSWPGLCGPIAFGMFRPTVAIPMDFHKRFRPDQRNAMLAHELAHLAGHDPAWLAAADLLCSLMWWHPGAWWVRRQLRSASEQVADAASSLVPGGPVALAESLVILGRELAATSPSPAMGAEGSRFRSDLGRRVDLLLGEKPSWRPMGLRDRIWIWTLAGVCAVAVLALPIPGAPQESLLDSLRTSTGSDQVTPVDPAVTARSQSDLPLVLAAAPDADAGPVSPTEAPRPRMTLEWKPEVSFGRVEGYQHAKSVYVALRDPDLARSSPVPSQTELREPGLGNEPKLLGQELLTRTYRVEPSRLPEMFAAMEATEGVPPGTNRMVQMRAFFTLCGIEFPDRSAVTNPEEPGTVQSQAAFYFNDRGILFVRSTLGQLDRIGSAIAMLVSWGGNSNTTPAITLAAHFAEITEGGPEDIGLDWLFGLSATNNPVTESVPWKPDGSGLMEILRVRGQSGVLSAAQYGALRQRLLARQGVEILSAPTITTTSGRQAKVQVSEVRTIVTGVNARVDGTAEAVGFDAVLSSPTNTLGVEYQVEQIPFGPELEIIPIIDVDQWHLDVTARLTEFLGYDDPGDDLASIRVPGGKPLTAQKPLPHFRRRELIASVRVGPDEVVALWGPRVEVKTVRKGGLFARDRTEVAHKRLYVFVEATPGKSAAEGSPVHGVQPVIVQILPDADGFRLGSREVRDFELSGVLRSLALTRPGLLLIIRSDFGAPTEKVDRFQEVARRLGIPNAIL